MTYWLYGTTLAFAWFLAINLALSVIVAAAADRIADATRGEEPAARARILLGLRLMPAAASLAFVLLVFLPAFWRHEPRNVDEAFSVTTMTLTTVACAVIVMALARGARALRDAAHGTRAWMASAAPIALPGSALAAFAVDAPQPAMTLVGIWRPRLLVTRRIVELLTAEELCAALAHERCHQRSHDNLKRLVMRATPDALSLMSASRRIDRAWSLSAEHEADRGAAVDARARLALASALVKVARLTPSHAEESTRSILSSPLVGGNALASRVERLVNPDVSPRRPRRALLGWSMAASALAALTLGYTPLLAQVHALTEVAVHVLP